MTRRGGLVAEIGVTLKPAPASTLRAVGAEIFVPFAFTAALALALALLLAREVTRPLYKLRASIDRIGKGDLTAAATANGSVEFTEMAAAINAMAAGLRERETVERASWCISRQVLDLITSKGELPGQGRD